MFSGFAFTFKADCILLACGFQLPRSMNTTPLDPAAHGSAGEAGWGTGAEAGPPPALLSTLLA